MGRTVLWEVNQYGSVATCGWLKQEGWRRWLHAWVDMWRVSVEASFGFNLISLGIQVRWAYADEGEPFAVVVGLLVGTIAFKVRP